MNTKQKQLLKAKAHKLKPIVILGNQGFTANVKMEINRGLDDHELIKVRINAEDREERRALFAEICETVAAEPIQMIGSIATLYREKEVDDSHQSKDTTKRRRS